MKRGLRPFMAWPTGLVVGALLMIGIGYNTWSYCCGRCSIRTFCQLGEAGWSLVGITALAGVVWLALGWVNRRRERRLNCPCGRNLIAAWHFCPDCGRQAPANPVEKLSSHSSV